MPKIGFTQFLNDLGAFLAIFKSFIFFEIFPSFLVWKIGEKCHFLVPIIGFTQFLNDLGAFFKIFKIWAISRKMSFFSAQNWFYPISERFGSLLAIFQIFQFFESFPSFLVWKWANKNFL